MGFICDPTPEMGEYHVEVRRESFYLRGEDDFAHAYNGEKILPRHAIITYGHRGPTCDRQCSGTVEILHEDIPKIRAALDQVERHLAGERV